MSAGHRGLPPEPITGGTTEASSLLPAPPQVRFAGLEKNHPTLFAEPSPPDVVTTEKGHGRIERRELRVRADLVGYSAFPGLAQVAELQKEVVEVVTGEITRITRYLVTSLGPEQADAARLLALARRHWGIENRWFHVADDGFGEDRQVLQDHDRGQVLGLLRGAALNLLRGQCDLWDEETPLTARAEWVNGHPLRVLVPRSRL
jgi:hypothetical protein